jgi:ABC-2 type transport system ATP-binding protein
VRVVGLSKSFGRVPALTDVSFEVPAGAVYGLLGPNGAGKTTFFSVCANFLMPTSGSVEVLGIDVRQVSRLRGRFSMLPQDARFQPNVPVVEQLLLLSRLTGRTRIEARQEAARALDLVGLGGELMTRAVRTLSHGMLKRMALAQAFIGDPEVVFLDEPTAGLDPQNTAGMQGLIRRMAGEKTVMISSHNLREIQELCSHCAILDRGRLVTAGAMSDLLGSDYLVRLTFSQPMTDQFLGQLQRIPEVRTLVPNPAPGIDLTIDVGAGRDKDAILADILACCSAAGFVPRSLNEGALLEQRFLQMTAPAPHTPGGTPTPGTHTPGQPARHPAESE